MADTNANSATPPQQYKKPPPRGGATAFDTRYKVEQLMYPNDLMAPTGGGANKYGGNYVVFYINVHEDSYLVKGDNPPVVENLTPREAGSLAGQKYNTATVLSGAAVAGTAAALASDAAGKVVKMIDKDATPNGVVNAVGNALIGGAAAAAIVTALGGANKEYKRMNTAIALNMPMDLNVRYSASWESDSLAGSQALLEGMSNITSPMNAGQAGAGYLAGAALKTPGMGGLVSKSSGVAANPKKEQIFQEVDFRTFTFTYQFFPRSPEEAQNVRNIIKAFKLHMHPEYKPDRANFLFIYPSEFDIFYYQNGKENLNIHRHTSCVLTDMSVLYTPQGVFTAFDDGMPSQVNMTLTFKELAILTKENIEDGF